MLRSPFARHRPSCRSNEAYATTNCHAGSSCCRTLLSAGSLCRLSAAAPAPNGTAGRCQGLAHPLAWRWNVWPIYRNTKLFHRYIYRYCRLSLSVFKKKPKGYADSKALATQADSIALGYADSKKKARLERWNSYVTIPPPSRLERWNSYKVGPPMIPSLIPTASGSYSSQRQSVGNRWGWRWVPSDVSGNHRGSRVQSLPAPVPRESRVTTVGTALDLLQCITRDPAGTSDFGINLNIFSCL